MTFFHKRDSKYFEEGARSLIKAITGFEEDDENFEICLNFTLSNFSHHRFLEVNSHQVRRTVDGLCEKYTIQSHYEKAAALRSLSSSLFESITKEGSTERETDYAVLSLLLHLSESVDGNQEIIKVLEDDAGEKLKEEIDWAEYLQEGEEEYVAFSDEDKLWSDGEEEDSLEEDFFTCPPRRDDSGIDVSPESNNVPSQINFQSSETTYPASKQTWLHHYVKTPYWNPEHQVSEINPPSETLSANLTKEWEKHMQKDTMVYVPETKTMLTEDIIIRESLWMLHGVKSLYLFSWDGTQFAVNSNVHLSHLTSNTLAELLSKLCTYGNKVVLLHDFIGKAYSPDIHSSYHCQTYQAYATSLCSSLKQFSDLLASIEKKIISQEETLTLSQLFQKLKPCLENLELISCIHSEAVQKCPTNSSSQERAVRLLTVLWKYLTQSNTWMSTSTVQTVLSLFLKTIRPYFSLLEGLVNCGHLEDPCQEFIVQRKENVNVMDKEFWRTAFSLQNLPSDVGSDFFLKPLLPDILLAGKSMEMLRHLGHLSEITSLQDSSGSLYSQLLVSVQDLFSKLVESSGAQDGGTHVDVVSDPRNFEDQYKGVVDWEKYIPPDPLLQKNFDDILNCDDSYNFVDSSGDMDKILKNLHTDVLLPLNLILEGAMHSCIKNACHISCCKLIQVLKEKHRLMSHVSVMKKYYLMESGDVMFSFYSEIFQKICSGDKWQDLSFLFLVLQDAISKQDEEIAQRLSIFLKNENQVISKPLSHLDSLQLFYEAQWPIKVVLSSDAQKQYCQVFCFLLQVKCAKYVLDELRFADLQFKQDESDASAVKAFMPKPDMPKEQKIHGMLLLRMRLLHFVNGFHTYVMTSILHSSGLELDEELEKVENLDQVIYAHTRYLSSLHERCLLDTKLSLLKEQIFRILNLSLKFQQLWHNEIDKISLEELGDIEKEFNSCHNLLTSYLNKPLKRGAYPHLKALACAVLYTSPLQRIFVGS